MIKTIKILVAIIVAIVAFFAYSYYAESQSPAGDVIIPTLSSSSGTNGLAYLPESQRLLEMLVLLKSIQINTQFFDQPIFKVLVDFSTELEEEPVGRTNPFAPIGTEPEEEVAENQDN